MPPQDVTPDALRDNPACARRLGFLARKDPSAFSSLLSVISHVTRTVPEHPSGNTTSKDPNLTWIIAALEALEYVIKYGSWGPPPSQEIIDCQVRSLQGHIPGVWVWIWHIFDQYVITRTPFASANDDNNCHPQYSTLCFSLLGNFMKHDPWANSLILSPHFSENLARIFLYAIGLDPTVPTNNAYLASLERSALFMMKHPSWVNESSIIAQVLLEDMVKTANRILGPFIRSLEPCGVIHLKCMKRHCMFFMFCSVSGQYVHVELLRHGCVRWLSMVLQKLCAQLLNTRVMTVKDAEQIAKILKHVFFEIGISADLFGYKPLEVALRHHLLVSICQFLDFVTRQPPGSLPREFYSAQKDAAKCLECLATHTTNIKIVYEISRELKLVQESETLTSLISDSSMLKLLDIFEYRNDLVENEVTHSYASHMTECDNEQVSFWMI
ncbi:hypothetical protein VKT23_012867 [Stygiomarasmius scandens]|uniref:Uncharacterized protein n=1 Tax=Marasmiellus scandens TaxID=2682957 RepID=A0ABR1J4Q5_9AGAR